MSIPKKDHINTICSRCGGRETHIRPNGYAVWIKDVNEEGYWDRKSYLCSYCYDQYHNKNHELIRSEMKCRNDQISLVTTNGKGIIGECSIAKVRKLDVLSIKFDNFRFKLDLSVDHEYGNIQSKYKVSYYGDWTVKFGIEHNFDTLFSLCASKNMKDIERAYAIPEEELYGKQGIRLVGNISNRGSKWEKFRIDEKPYDDAYKSLMIYLKDKRYFGIEDIKKWLELM